MGYIFYAGFLLHSEATVMKKTVAALKELTDAQIIIIIIMLVN